MNIFTKNTRLSQKALSAVLSFSVISSIFQPFTTFAAAPAVSPDVVTAIETIVVPGTTSWIVPADVTEIRVRTWGAGGSGGNGSTTGDNVLGGGGGGGAGYAEADILVTPGETFSAIVGRGGISTEEGAGRSGETTSFNSSTTTLVSASGGVGGKRGTEVQASAPTVSLSATPKRFNSGESTTIVWSSTNTDSCVASGMISGNKAVSGSQTVTRTSSGSVTLTCTGLGGTASASLSVTVDNCGPRGGCYTGPNEGVTSSSSEADTTVVTNPTAADGEVFNGIAGTGLVGAILESGVSANPISFNSSSDIDSTDGGAGARGGAGGSRSTTANGADGVAPGAGAGGSDVAFGGNGAHGQIVIESIVRGGPIVNGAPTTPVVVGPVGGDAGVSYSFSALSTDPEGETVRYGFDWDNDGTIDQYTAYEASGVATSTSRTWDNDGTYTFKVYAEDVNGNRSTAASHTIVLTNCGPRGGCYPGNTAPDSLTVTGPTTGTVGVSYDFVTRATDAEGDTIRYAFDWDNNSTYDEYTAFGASGVSTTTSHAWSTAGSYTFKVIAEDSNGERSSVVSHTIVITTGGGSGNSAPSGLAVSGPTTGDVNVSYAFTATATDPESSDVRYGFDWDNNGTIDTFTGFVTSGTASSTSHAWATAGTYTFSVYAEDTVGARSGAVTHTITIQNCGPRGGCYGNTAPSGLTISGPIAGTVGVSYDFVTRATDPEGDTLRYGFDWDNDGTIDEFTAYGASGVSATTSHAWSSAGTYTFKAYAEDMDGARSSAVSHTIAITTGGTSGGNNAPVVTSITGTTTAAANVSHTFTATATDADGDDIQYGFDWNNNGVIETGAGEEWTSSTLSGVSVSRSNSWAVSGDQTFAVFARDSRGATSSPATFTVNIVGGLTNIGFAVNAGANLSTSEAGATASFTVVLTATTTANVTLPIMSSDLTEGTTTIASLTFTPANWNVYQTVTVTGVDDSILDGNISYVVTVGPAVSADLNYNGIPAQTVSLINYDNEIAPPTTTSGGGGRSGGPCIGFGCPTTTTPVTPVIDPIITFCPASDFIVSYMRKGSQNDPNEVRKLQYFLNTYEGTTLAINGVFDDATEQAVMLLQSRHADEILAPWNISEPTGIVYITTSSYINRFFCDENPIYQPGDLDTAIGITPTETPVIDNSGDFEGAIGMATTSASSTDSGIFDNLAGAFGAFSGAVIDFLRSIPWYPLIITLLVLTGSAYILRGIYVRGVPASVTRMSFIKGTTALASGTVLNVLNTMSFMGDPEWLSRSTGLGMTWILALGLINLLAVLIISIAFLVNAHLEDLKASK